MGGKSSKEPSEAEQRRILQLHTIKVGLGAAPKPVHFENLVFEGSGNKAVSYYGALKVLQEVGLLDSIHRFAGVGAGAGWAMLLAIGLSPTEIAELNLDNELSYHANFGLLAMIPNIAQKLGWSPLGRAVKIVQRVIEQRTGKPAITFKEVLDTYKQELCIVATNLTTGSLEYFHPKTTPEVSIVDALVMSATLPGIMKPKYLMRGGQKHFFVDGGVLCNYPIHAFDGWYLSMKKEDSFLSRVSAEPEPPFKGYNDKTLGIVTVSPGDGDFGEKEFLQRLQYEVIERPNTKLARSQGPESESRYQRTAVQGQVQVAGQRLLERLREANINGQSQISGEDFQRALGEGPDSSSVDDIQLLFGKTREELTAIFEQLNAEREGKITFDEFVEVAQQESGSFRQHLEGGGTHRNIRNMPDIFRAVLSAVEGNSKRAYLKEIDIIRSIGVNTDYVGSLDLLGHNDKHFLVVQGEAACMAFLLDYSQKFAPGISPMPIYSALPQRQMSDGSSVIDPAEMATYTVPQNLYPTLPPSYESAMGDPRRHFGAPPEAGTNYNYHPEKQPLPPDSQVFRQVPVAMPLAMQLAMPVAMPVAAPEPTPVHLGPDPWALPRTSQGTSAAVGASQPHKVVVTMPPVESSPTVCQCQVTKKDSGQALPRPGPVARPAHRHVGPTKGTSFFIAPKSQPVTPQLVPQNPAPLSHQKQQAMVSSQPNFMVSVGQPAISGENRGGFATSAMSNQHHVTISSGTGSTPSSGGALLVKNVQFQQPPTVRHHQPVRQQNVVGLRLQQKSKPRHQFSVSEPQHSQPVLLRSPIQQRRAIVVAPPSSAETHGRQQQRIISQPQSGPSQNHLQRKLAAVQNEHGQISHFLVVS